MNQADHEHWGKVPEVTLWFWIIKIAATTLGETGGDAVTMSMNLGYFVGTAIFAALFVVAVAAQIRARQYHAFLFWAVIIATITAGTTLADLLDRSLGIGYLGGTTILVAALFGTLYLWHRSLGSVNVSHIDSPKAEMFYWATVIRRRSEQLSATGSQTTRAGLVWVTKAVRSSSGSPWPSSPQHISGRASRTSSSSGRHSF
jgi:uncharacterized membrane-anchored protein